MGLKLEEIEEFLAREYWQIETGRSVTRKACVEVLSRLPQDVAERIVYGPEIILLAPGEEWGRAIPKLFSIPVKEGQAEEIPGAREIGSSLKIIPVRLCFVYLALELEKQELPVVVGVVAHEVAHAISGDIIGDESERLADRMIQDWGFGSELEALRQANPHHRY